MAVIDVRHLTKTVITGSEELTILDDLTFQIEPGDQVAIVGRSGSGKSTLLSLLAGFDNPTAGAVYFDGLDWLNLSEDRKAIVRARKVGFIFQHFQLLPMLTALENVMLPLEIAKAPDAESRAMAVLDRVGLAERLHHFPRQLSGGEQQRVAVARAFVVDPAVLLADEPTGSLDAANGQTIIDLMFAMNAERQATLILVTHDGELAGRCRRSIRLEAGRIVSPE